MAKQFTKLGKEITMAVKQGGPDPSSNPRLRLLMQNAKSVNMPKDRIENAIKRVTDKDARDYEEVVYEGYGPYGVGIVVETATDNPTRTVANVRMHFTRAGGSLGKTGSLEFMFDRIGVFKISPEGINPEELELELIDFGAEEVFEEEGVIYVYTDFSGFGAMQKALEERNIQVISAELQRIPTTTVELTAEQEEEINKLVEKFEEDDDVQNVFTNMK